MRAREAMASALALASGLLTERKPALARIALERFANVRRQAGVKPARYAGMPADVFADMLAYRITEFEDDALKGLA